ncbi:hypothetical protein K9U39_04910 [Rhodoblastus acidophilus]|uniref:Uncharacterized protein n=1 Tax=Candidatus Rhodoblastus alkanivorans TaxID=2954117 RepID=A0ABS9Z5T2_9HYPH|nr:hypothetical protein [Candidatus Rhodoblastus alkanivorans]MCI4680105.1 hypothetical protein [Candidatus Rhodoblastus alkanivorans]MCI4682983.1 hypothetical protein [Candidatus Rhodoblastus alkanivorans]MDI4640293.1 hypothetical protein [Rhodoblastus acidophilus]
MHDRYRQTAGRGESRARQSSIHGQYPHLNAFCFVTPAAACADEINDGLTTRLGANFLRIARAGFSESSPAFGQNPAEQGAFRMYWLANQRIHVAGATRPFSSPFSAAMSDAG